MHAFDAHDGFRVYSVWMVEQAVPPYEPPRFERPRNPRTQLATSHFVLHNLGRDCSVLVCFRTSEYSGGIALPLGYMIAVCRYMTPFRSQTGSPNSVLSNPSLFKGLKDASRPGLSTCLAVISLLTDAWPSVIHPDNLRPMITSSI